MASGRKAKLRRIITTGGCILPFMGVIGLIVGLICLIN